MIQIANTDIVTKIKNPATLNAENPVPLIG